MSLGVQLTGDGSGPLEDSACAGVKFTHTVLCLSTVTRDWLER